MSKTEEYVCPVCGMQGVTDPSSCPNCTGTIPKVRKGDLSPGAWILLVVGFVVVVVMAGTAGLGSAVDIAIVAVILLCVAAGVVGAIKKRR